MKYDYISTVARDVSVLYGVTKRKLADDVAKNLLNDCKQRHFLPALMTTKFMALMLATIILLYELVVAGDDPGILSHLIVTMFIVNMMYMCIHLLKNNHEIDVFHYNFMTRKGEEGKYLKHYINDDLGIDLLKHCLRLTNIQNRLVQHVSMLLIMVCMHCFWNLGFEGPLILYVALSTGYIILKILSIRKAKWFLHFLREKHMEFNVFYGEIRFEIRWYSSQKTNAGH